MYMRLGFAVAAHLSADILLLDEVFAVGDEAFQQKCFGKIFEFKRRGGTIVFVSHDASAVEKLCERAVLLRRRPARVRRADARRDLALPPAALAERDPAERKAGLREWGSGEARIAEVELLAADGSERRQFLAGEPLTLRVRIETDRPLPPPRLTYELRTDAGLLLAAGCRTPESSAGTRRRASARCASTSTGCRSPTAVSSFASGCPTRQATISTIGSMTLSLPRLSRTAASAGFCASKGAGRTEEIDTAAEMRTR